MHPGALVRQPARGLAQREPPTQALRRRRRRSASRPGIQSSHCLHRGREWGQKPRRVLTTRARPEKQVRGGQAIIRWVGLVLPDRPAPLRLVLQAALPFPRTRRKPLFQHSSEERDESKHTCSFRILGESEPNRPEAGFRGSKQREAGPVLRTVCPNTSISGAWAVPRPLWTGLQTAGWYRGRFRKGS
jgi:hypothetical protein